MRELNIPPLKDYFRGHAKRTHVQFFRYGFVAVAAFIVDFGLLALLVQVFGFHYLAAAAIAFCLGLVTNYALSVRWVFTAYNVNNRWREFTIFALVGVVGLGLTEFFIWLFTEPFQIHYLLSKLISSGIVIIWNFGARKMLLYRDVKGEMNEYGE